MQGNIKKRGAIISAAVILLLVAAYLAIILFALCSESLGDIVAWLAVLVYIGLLIAIVLGVLAALRQRLGEIDKGEEEAAKIY